MNKEKIAKIVSLVKSKKASNKKSKENIVDIQKDKALKVAQIIMDIEKSLRNLED